MSPLLLSLAPMNLQVFQEGYLLQYLLMDSLYLFVLWGRPLRKLLIRLIQLHGQMAGPPNGNRASEIGCAKLNSFDSNSLWFK